VIPFWILDFRFSVERSSGKKVFCLALCALLLALGFPVEAQQPKINRVGVLLPGEHWSEIIDGLRAGLKELGLQDGKQFILKSGIPKRISERRRKQRDISNAKK
jgi:ABC-type uncharacterized transport system substrate-binding protein